MRVLMVSSGYYPNYSGGVEVLVKELSEGLVKKGNEVCVIYASNENKEYYINDVKVIAIKPKGLKENRINHIVNRLLQLYNPFNKREFSKTIDDFKPDIIHLHMARALSLSILDVAFKKKIKTVSTLHEYFSLWNFNPFSGMEYIKTSKAPFYLYFLRNKQRKLTKKVDYITAPIEDIIEIYKKEKYYVGVNSKVIDNAILFDKNYLPKKKGKKFKFLILSRLMPFKGLEVSLESFSKINNDDIELHIAGSGYLEKMVLDYQKKDKRIKYHGFVMDKEKEELLNECNCLLFAVDDLETFGLSALEALHHGMPVITTNVRATTKLVDDDKNGYILKNKTVKNMIKCMNKMIDSDYSNFSKNAINKSNSFSYEKMINEYIKIYKKVLMEE